MKKTVPIEVHRYDPEVDEEPRFEEHEVPFERGMKLLDALKQIQKQDPSLAFRWNCGEGVCGSDAMRLDGKPVLACKTTLTEDMTEQEDPLRVEPLQVFPVIKDLVADYSQVYEKEAQLEPYFQGEEPRGEYYEMHEEEVATAQEMRQCINCMACYDVCHVLREQMKDFAGPRNIVKVSSMEFHPKDVGDRAPLLADEGAIDKCNVTRCCSQICPQDITITQDAIIPHKERAVTDTGKDPVLWLVRRTRKAWRSLKARMGGDG